MAKRIIQIQKKTARMSKISLPEDARLAINIQFLTEWWSDHGKLPGSEYSNRCLGSAHEYGARAGAYWILEVLRKNGVKSTAMFSGLVAEKFPGLVHAVADEGHEICGHGYDQSRYMYKLNKEEEHETIRQCTRLLEVACGRRPLGWSSSARSCTPHTLELLMEEGYVWNNDLTDSDLPYLISANGKTIVMVPAGVACTDLEEFVLFDPAGHRQTLRGPREALDLMIGLFDAAYSRSSPKLPLKITLGWHSWVGGKPEYVWTLDKFIQYAKGHSQVVFVTNLEMAQWWLKNCV